MINSNYIQNFMARLCFPDGARHEFMNIIDILNNMPDILSRFENTVNTYMYACRQKALCRSLPSERKDTLSLNEALSRMGILADTLHISHYTLEFIFCMVCTEKLLDIYKEKQISEMIFWNTMKDFKCKLTECQNIFGCSGIFVAWWYDRFFEASRFGLGRFQFENERFNHSMPVKIHKTIIYPGDPVINIHIPSDGPLTKELRRDSYSRAYNFFNTDAAKPPMAFVCDSWLLYPKHRQFLPKASNIIDFMNDFQILSSTEQPDFPDGWRVFGADWIKHKKNPQFPLPQKTSLQSAYAQWLSHNHKAGTGYGIFLYDGSAYYTE